jgi:chemotaxis protein methyltransferase CheR
MLLEKQDVLSDQELYSLTTGIKKRYGIDFTNYEPKSLKRGFTRLIMRKKLDSVLQLWSIILKDREFFMGCIDELTVNLTELFRNPEIWIKLKEDVLPQYKKKYKLNIWHAGCSSGEEVYTMAIVLKHMDMLRRTKSMATDLSARILDQAIKGAYSSRLLTKYAKSFSAFLPNGNLEDCFTYGESEVKVKNELKKHVKFKIHNLVQDKMDEKFNVIFCRNVMIYFDDSLKMKVLQLFHDSLEDDGFFIIGYYDMLPYESKVLFEVYDSKTRIYKKVKLKG